jgi:hypothetical protein
MNLQTLIERKIDSIARQLNTYPVGKGLNYGTFEIVEDPRLSVSWKQIPYPITSISVIVRFDDGTTILDFIYHYTHIRSPL